MMNAIYERKSERYRNSIMSLPAARGTGSYHAGLCSVTAHGIHLGFTVEEIKRDLTSNGRGCFQRTEVEDAYRSCVSKGCVKWDFDKPLRKDVFSGLPQSKTIQPTIDRVVRNEKVEKEMMELIESSPYRLLDNPSRDLGIILEYGFKPEEYVFIGDTYDTDVFKVSDAMSDIQRLRLKPFTCVNPFSGNPEPTNDGKLSRRSDKAVSKVRYMLIEMDDTTISEQVGFWLSGIDKLPVFAIIDSGKKSLHGWVKVDCSIDEWDSQRDDLFKLFEPFGIDKACKNKGRLSRTAGHDRKNGHRQNLLYLNPKQGA